MIPAWLLLTIGFILLLTASGPVELLVGVALASVGMAGIMGEYRGRRR